MPTNDDIIHDVLAREGDQETNDPLDHGGRTKYGISERANPEAWADGHVTEEEAKHIYTQKYITGPGFDHVIDFHLRAQLVDFGVNSGPSIAIMKLQEILHVPIDGLLGPQTLDALALVHPEAVSNGLVAARVRMICRIVKRDPGQLKFLSGWIDRALEVL